MLASIQVNEELTITCPDSDTLQKWLNRFGVWASAAKEHFASTDYDAVYKYACVGDEEFLSAWTAVYKHQNLFKDED